MGPAFTVMGVCGKGGGGESVADLDGKVTLSLLVKAAAPDLKREGWALHLRRDGYTLCQR
jgi:hypothetical protein